LPLWAAWAGQQGLREGGQLKFREGGQLKFPEFHNPPHEKQLKSLLEGAKIEPLTNGQYLCTEAKLQTFRPDGTGEMVVEAPSCVFDSQLRSINSPGRLEVRTADGKFSIAGDGFSLQQTNSNLTISNHVHTIIEADLLGPRTSEAPAEASPKEPTEIHIFSDRFDYATNSGAGVYRGNVRVQGTNINVTASTLTVLVPMSQPGKVAEVRELTAEDNVIMDYNEVHATGQRATYSAQTGLAHITGQPTWRARTGEGNGDELIIDRTNQIFYANGHAFMKMPGQSLSTSTFLPNNATTKTNSTAVTNQFVEIHSDVYELRTNLALFKNNVHLEERAGDQTKSQMTCTNLLVTFSGTNQLHELIADGQVNMAQVNMDQEEQGFTAGRAVYSGTNGLLELTDQPAWHVGPRTGTGERILVFAQDNQMIVRGNANMRMPAEQMGQATASTAKKTNAGATNQYAQIFSDVYGVTPEAALFRGHVRIESPQMGWTCEQMEAEMPGAGGKLERITAERNVLFDLTDEKGQKVHGEGQRAVYYNRITATATNELLELTGSPFLETTNGTFRNSVILLDRAKNKLVAPGKYRMRGPVPSGLTNAFKLPLK
jgi:lipopolysaccharide export system protein LptA